MKAVAVLCVMALVAVQAAPHVHRHLRRDLGSSLLQQQSSAIPDGLNGAIATACAAYATAPTALVDTCVEDVNFRPVTRMRALQTAADQAATPESKVLGKVIADILLVTPKMISYNPFKSGPGATCVLRYTAANAFAGYAITFVGDVPNTDLSAQGINDANAIKTAQVMHELTHCRLHDVFGAYMLSYKKPTAVVGAPNADDINDRGCFKPGREAVWQGKHQHMDYHMTLATNALALQRLVPAGWRTGNPTEKLIAGKAEYMVLGSTSALEYDAPAAQALALCFQTPSCRAATAFYAKLAAINEEVLCRRHLNNGVPKAAKDAPTPKQDCTGY